ncbi:YqaE/Pmp3 family membrane protein [Desulfobulbus sp. US1]|nr:YqaE/Pmp3 family membrane protein [Desulfobulbus sp. US4]MCW5209142.1 YqaE/Pmp3 family membrane protein [Desulfobulbus sp. US1]WLE96131.1 MAG: YqaE/Pmp3 family membrane protein [Candidatus Electrothrix communis]
MKEKTADFLRIILSLIIPPVGVFLQVGFGMHFWINILLTLLGYLPGVLHAIYIILKK